MGDLTDTATPSTTTATTTAIPPYTHPLPDSGSRRKEQFSLIIDALNAFPNRSHRTGVQCKSRKDYMKKIHEVKKGPATSTSSNRRTLKPSRSFPKYRDASMEFRDAADLVNLLLAVEERANDVPLPTSSFFIEELATPINKVTKPGSSKQQATASPISSILPSPFSPLQLPASARARARAHAHIDSCGRKACVFCCWSQEATFTLIEAWGHRCVELNRDSLRQVDWQHVANAVNALHAKSKKNRRNRFQCAICMAFIKEKYKYEKALVTSSNRTLKSSWPFFDRMDAWMSVGEQADLQNLMQGLNIAPVQPVPTASPPQPVSSTPASQSGEDYGFSSLSLA